MEYIYSALILSKLIEKEIKEAASMPVMQAAAPAAEAKKEDKKSKEDEEKSAESAAAGLGALFG